MENLTEALARKPVYWSGRPYHSLDYHIRQTFGEKLYKISLDAGLTCPNRDGTLGERGCIFCSQGGSGDFASAEKLMAEGVRNGTISIEDDVYALFNGMICQSLGMEALENDDDEKGADYLQSARSFFIMAKERGLDIPPVSSAIHMLNMFFGLDEDDDEDYDGGGMFDTDAIDYLGVKKVFPKGDEF